MKQLLALTLIAGITLASCSKKANTPNPQAINTVTINGAAYPSVKISSQTWTATNYNGTGGVNYNNSNTNIPNNGKLYTLAEANAIVIPDGWRLPTQDDYTTLLASSSALGLMGKTSWTIGGGTNSSGFNALAVGYNHHNAFDGTGTDAVFITTSELADYPGIPSSFNIYQDNTGTGAVLSDFVVTATDRASIRFIKSN
jgi:uncharacterized protein (TIGR02145 family)